MTEPATPGTVHVFNREPGCPVNQALTNRVHNFLVANGWTLADLDRADRFVLVSCSALPAMRERLVSMVEDFARAHPEKQVVVTCCYMQGDRVGLPNVAYVPLSETDRFDEIFGAPRVSIRDVSSGATLEDAREVGALRDARDAQSLFVHPYNVMVAVGCLNRCAFCSGKSMFPTVQSVPLDEVVAECLEGVRQGYTNFILGASDLASYGRDIGCDVTDLFRAIFQRVLEGRPALALGLKGIEPSGLLRWWPDLRDHFATGRIRWLELPIQSGSDAVLRAMNRRYRAEDVLNVMREIRLLAPGIQINTDVIFCYPTETAEDFRKTLDAMEHFDNVQMLAFQRHRETPAARMEDVFDEAERARRQALADEAMARRGSWTDAPPAEPPEPRSGEGFFRVQFSHRQRDDVAFDFTLSPRPRGDRFRHGADGCFLEARFDEPPRGAAPLLRVLVASMRLMEGQPPSAGTLPRWQALLDEVLSRTEAGRHYRCTLTFVAD